ncbi:hypothetical protein GQ44DRAFT_115629 [Phaeosphaeriaceae sp. PMI808]|nr:hypothetical protein GQ44DRAFT_734516 [Phaeosphaeriaceae sp. PMI808]KAH8727440.1 hypothetical protein GQ44DRAFT_115629 [Phaeosphaeriaceae sp. PMI808]
MNRGAMIPYGENLFLAARTILGWLRRLPDSKSINPENVEIIEKVFTGAGTALTIMGSDIGDTNAAHLVVSGLPPMPKPPGMRCFPETVRKGLLELGCTPLIPRLSRNEDGTITIVAQIWASLQVSKYVDVSSRYERVPLIELARCSYLGTSQWSELAGSPVDNIYEGHPVDIDELWHGVQSLAKPDQNMECRQYSEELIVQLLGQQIEVWDTYMLIGSGSFWGWKINPSGLGYELNLTNKGESLHVNVLFELLWNGIIEIKVADDNVMEDSGDDSDTGTQ